MVETEGAHAQGLPQSDFRKQIEAQTPLGRIGQPEDIAPAVVPVAGTLDLKALATAAGGRKAVMADPADAERSTGYVRGGISPLGQKKRLRTFIDSSAQTQPSIHVSAGRRGLEVELAAQALAEHTGGCFASIGRP